MAGNNYNITGDLLPRDSANHYMMAWYDPVNNNFQPPYAVPVQVSAAGLAIGHMMTGISDVLTATGVNSSGVDLLGYTVRGLYQPAMGSACWVIFDVSGYGMVNGWQNLVNSANVSYSATGGPSFGMAYDQTILSLLAPYRFVRMRATVNQTANRTFVWQVAT